MSHLIKQVRTIDAALSIFENGNPARKPRGYVTERYRYVLSYLRATTGPVTVPEIVASWVDHKGIITNPEIRNELRRRVRSTLYKLQKRGEIEQIGSIGRRKVWRLLTHQKAT